MADHKIDLAGVILGMGNPLLDLSAEVPMSMLEKYDVKLNNAVLAEEKHMPMYAELAAMNNVEYIAGGATQNTIRVAQWMLQTPGATSYFGSIGKDAFGETLQKCATADGVNVMYHVEPTIATGTCACLINNQERSLIANLSAANHFKIEHLKQASVEAVWKKARIYYIAGFFLTVSPPSALFLAEHALASNKVFAMNLSAPFISMFFGDALASLMPYIDILFGNESEAKAYGEKNGVEDLSVAGVAKYIAQLPKKGDRPRLVVFTQGKDATIAVQGSMVAEFAVAPIPADKIVDVNGAGDAFVGGFLSELARGHSLTNCVEAGHYASSVILLTSGTVLTGKTPAFKPKSYLL